MLTLQQHTNLLIASCDKSPGLMLVSKLRFYVLVNSRVTLGHVHSILTSGSQTHTEVTACD